MEIVTFILAIVVPLYIGWQVWRAMDRRDNPEFSEVQDTLSGLIKKILYTIAVTFVCIFFFFLLIDLMAT